MTREVPVEHGAKQERIRALERHLAKYPDSPQKEDIERAITKSAIEARDDKRIVLYGERVLARNNENLEIIEKVTRLLLSTEDRESNERALKYAKRFEETLRAFEKQGPSTNRNSGALLDELDRALGDRAIARSLIGLSGYRVIGLSSYGIARGVMACSSKTRARARRLADSLSTCPSNVTARPSTRQLGSRSAVTSNSCLPVWITHTSTPIAT